MHRVAPPAEPQRLADTTGARCQWPVAELGGSAGDSLGQPDQSPSAVDDKAMSCGVPVTCRGVRAPVPCPEPSPRKIRGAVAGLGHDSGLGHRVQGLLQRVQVVDAHHHGCRTTVLVITTRPCSRSTWSTTSERRFLTSLSAIRASTDTAASVATLTRCRSARLLQRGSEEGALQQGAEASVHSADLLNPRLRSPSLPPPPWSPLR